MSPLIKLPPEIFHLITSLITDRDLSFLSRTSLALHQTANPLLYARQVKSSSHGVTFWAARENRVGTLRHLHSAFRPSGPGFDVFSVFTHPVHRTSYRLPELSYRESLPPERPRELVRFWAPIHQAVVSGSLEALEYMLGCGADVDSPSLGLYSAGTFFDTSPRLMFGDEQTLEYLQFIEKTAVVHAINVGRHDMLDLLLRSGASVEIPFAGTGENCGTTALHVAATLGSDEAVDVLVRGGYQDPNVLDGDGYPPLLWAALSGSGRPALKALADHGADLNLKVPSRRGSGDSHALVCVLRRRKKEAQARMLIDLGADPDPEGEGRQYRPTPRSDEYWNQTRRNAKATARSQPTGPMPGIKALVS